MSIAGATSFDSQKYLGLTVIKAVSPTSGYIDPVAWNGTITPTPNTQYTISFYAKASVETRIASFFYPNCTIKNISNYHTTTSPDGCAMTKLSTEWNRYSVTWTTSSSVSGAKGIIPIRLEHGNTTDGATVYLCGIKLEQSDKPSPWCTTYEETLAKNLSITPSSQYFKSTDGGKTFAPDTITIKPTIQGEINFGKWQYSIDGGVSFADAVSGQKGLTISNNVLTVSKDSSLYSDAVTMVTFRAVASDSSFYDTCSIAKIYDVTELEIGGVNLFVKATVTKGYWLSNIGNQNADGGWGYSDYIDVSGMKNYIASGFTNLGISPATCFYDSNKAFVSGVQSENQNSQNSKRKTLPIPSNAKYMRFSFALADIDTLKIEQGTKATAYSPAPEDVQTAILSTKSEISDVSLKVDNNKQAIEQRVEKTTYQQDLKLVKGDISKANEGLNKWRYEIYPKSLFASEYQGKSTMDVFAKNTNLTPSQSVLINDTDLSIAWNYDNNYIGYALTFAKFSAAKSVAITFAHDDGAHIYLNGKLIGGSDAYSQTGESLTLGFVKGWNCIEVVVNEGANTEGFKLGTTISAISECQLMNCYYGTPVARQSHITNQLVENTTNIEGVTTTMQKVMTTVGGSDRIDEFVNNYNKTIESEKQFKKTIGETYTTKDEFNGLEIGGRNLLLYSQTIRAHNDYYGVSWLTDEVETFNGCPVWSVKNQWGRLTWLFKSHVIDRGLVKVGDTLTYSLYAKTNNASGKSINCSYRFKGNANAYWFNASAFNIGTSWARYSVTFTVTKDMLATDTYMNEIGFEETASMSGDDKVYYACPKLERGTKATDYTPAPEDDEINGQNLVSNLPSNWEQGTVTEGSTTGTTYANTKSSSAGSVRPKELIPVSGNITISTAYSNQSKKPIRHWIAAYDINKNYLGNNYVSNAWNSFPRTLNMKDAKYIAIMVGYTDSSAITPSDISQICLKIERGTSATPFTLAPEDVNGKIVNVETIANQTAKKFEWIVKGESTSSNLALTDNALTAIANNINLTGKVTFNSFDQSLKDTINNKTNVSYLSLSSGGNNQACWKIATIKISGNYTNQDIIIEVNHRGHGYTECRIQFKNAGNPDPGLASFRQTGLPSKCWRIIKTANSTWELYLYKNESWDGGYVVKYINPYHTTGNVSVTWSGENADLPSGTTTTEQMIADQTTIDGGIITTGYISADRIAAGSITADKIATDAIKSRNYISSGGTQGSFLNLSDGSFTSPNLSWDSNGNLIATNANLSGQITATNGSIGRYDITETYLMTNSGSNASGIGGNQAFWAGAEDSNSAPFRVGYDGSFVAENATIYGNIKTGNIGDAGDTAWLVDGHLSVQGTANDTNIYSTWFKFGIGGDYYLKSVSDGVKCYHTMYATDFVADGLVYCSEVHSSGAVVIGADSESFYWAHGYQIGRGTSWGGVCLGDDSQQLRLYGSSIWASHSISTSDENLKENFTTLDQYENFYMNLNPIGFNYIGDYDGKKTHFGFGAHKTEDILESEGYDSDKFAVVTHRPLVQEDIEKRFGKDVEVDIETEYGISYTEFIALNTHMIQKTRRELTKVKQEKADLEVRLQAIEAKLGL